MEHTEGCVCVASSYGKLKGDRAILNSGKTFDEFMDRMKGIDTFIVHVNDPVRIAS